MSGLQIPGDRRRGGRKTITPPPPPTEKKNLLGAKQNFFPHKISIDKREVVDKKQQKMTIGKRACQPKSDVAHLNLSMYFFL